MHSSRTAAPCPRRWWSVVCALALAACGVPEEEPSWSQGTGTVAQPLPFSSPLDFSELRGLPMPPTSMDLTVDELLRILPTPRFDDLRQALTQRHAPTDKVRLLSASARDYPVFLGGRQILLPNADGVLAVQDPVITSGTLGANACSSTHVCAELYEPALEAQPYAAIVLVAPRVELVHPVETGGTSLLIAAGEFTANGHPVRTTPAPRAAASVEEPVEGKPAQSGRPGRPAGQFALYANVLKGVRVNATGELGEPGKNGREAQGTIEATVSGNYTPHPSVSCTLASLVRPPQDGGNGGAAGRSGDILVRYTSIAGRGVVREFNKAGHVTPRQCFEDENLRCQSLRCRWNPSIALCDMLTEADNAQCSDGIDNDHNGYTDCEDYACSKNPHVTVCPEVLWSAVAKEASAEACSDGVDNDADGKVDCADPECGVRSICQVGRPANGEYSESACNNGLDDDGDGFVDCGDPGCMQFSKVNYSAAVPPVLASCQGKGQGRGEAGADKCSDRTDNDGDGLADCQDPGCSGESVCNLGPELALTSGIEESTQAACTDGIDNDLDGATDCADRECQVNPRVTACGGERTLRQCTDGVDNDGDGRVDCADSGCSDNPYVKVCEPQYYPFLKESSTATCSDSLDNDGDGFTDCKDFQCLNNPLVVGVCGAQENTLEACSDGVDNDGDGRVDCQEDSCEFNPFHGDLLCRNRTQTWHEVSPSAYNGRFTDLEAEFISAVPLAGRNGLAGARVSRSVPVIVQEVPLGYCEDYETYLCVPRDETRSCVMGPTAKAGVKGTAGKAGAIRMLRVARRDVDMLRALLAPQTWRAEAAHGNAYFKQGKLQQAAFLYTQNILEMGGILSQAKLDCDVVPTGKPFPEVYLHGVLCPLLREDVTRLSYIQSQRNFFGLARDTPLNPHVRYEQRRDEFNTLFSVLDGSVNRWLTLANGLQLSAWMSQNQTQLDGEVSALGAELSAAEQRITVAAASMNALQQSMDNRKAAIQGLTQSIQTTDQRIANQYNTPGKGLGAFLMDLIGSVTAAYGGQFLTSLGGKAADALWGEVKKSFASESSPTPVTGSGPASHEGGSFLSGVWTALGEAASAAARSQPFKDKLKGGGTALWDIIQGNQKSTPRSLIADEVKKEILSQSQVEITLDLLDLQAQVSKAQAEFRLAQMERDTVLLRQRNAVTARDALKSLVDFGASGSLRAFDQLLLQQQVYSTAVRTLDELIFRYWELVRLAEYQYLPFDAATGGSVIPVAFREEYDFNLATYSNMQTRLVQLDGLSSHSVQSQTKYYRRLPGSAFKALGVGELTRLKGLGGLTTQHPALVGARFQVTAADLSAVPALSLLRAHRVRNVSLNVVTASGATAFVPAVLVRDTLDAFRMGNYVAEFELVDLDRHPQGSVRSVLHYLPLSACVSAPPASCDVASASCVTAFQNAPFQDACAVAPLGAPPATNGFHDRSLLGEWMLVIDPASYTGLGEVKALEAVFQVAGMVN
ncbi:MAG: hypothetical protein ABW123_27895 [Cystobacter sp.]